MGYCRHLAKVYNVLNCFDFKMSFLYTFMMLYIKKYYWFKPSVFKLVQLLSVQNRKELCYIGEYLKYALCVRSQYM